VEPDPRVQPKWSQGIVAALYLVAVGAVWQAVYHGSHSQSAAAATDPAAAAATDPTEAERCKVPEFAKAIGHEQMWKLHNNCL
jgi:hypothetical protein